MNRKKVYLYTRVSTKMQVDGYSLEAQEERLKKFAECQDMDVVGIYRDEGYSGKSIEGRPEFQRMMNDVKCHKDNVDLILVFKLSRFGRNTADVLNSVEMLKEYGCGLMCSEEPIDSTSAMGKVFIAILASVAEMERENILTQTMAGRIQKAENGEWNGGFAPYGYKLVDGKLEIEEAEAEAIRIIFNKFAHTSMGYVGVTKYLRDHCIKKIPRANGYLTDFSTHFVKNALDNPIYVGKITYGKRKNVKKEGTRNEYHVVEQKEYNIYDGVHEAIIDEATWKLVQEKRKATIKRLEKKHDLDHEYQLAGIVKCPICGKGLVGNPNRKKKADGTLYKTYYTYRCNYKDGTRGHRCSFTTQPAELKINEAVKEVVLKLVSNPNFAEKIKKLIDAKVDVTDINNECIQLEALLKQYTLKKDKLAIQLDELDVLDDLYDTKAQDFQKRIDSMYQKMSETKRALEKAEEKRNKALKDQITGEKVYQYLMVFGRIIDKCTDGEKKKIYNLLIEEVQIFDREQEDGRWLKSIKFRFPVYYNNDLIDSICWSENPSVETVVKLSLKKDTPKIEVTMEPDEESNYTPEEKATYQKIKDYVKDKYDVNVHTSYIAQVKRMCGLDMGENYNKSKKENPEVKRCPQEKVEYIKDALRYFGMI